MLTGQTGRVYKEEINRNSRTTNSKSNGIFGKRNHAETFKKGKAYKKENKAEN